MMTNKNLILQSCFAFISLSALQLTTWIPLRYWSAWGGGNFLDTWQILKYAKCYETVGLSVYENTGTECSNYLYGRTLLQLLSFLRIDASLTQFFGYTFLLLLAISLSMVFPIKNGRDCLVFTLVLFSPPVMLLADRGNFDILVFFILIHVAKSTARGNFLLAYILLSITVLLKYYTAPVFLLLIFYSKLPREKILGAVLLLTCSGLAFRDIAITDAQYPHGSDAQFGFTVWGEYLNKFSSTQVNEIQIYFISATVFISILILTFISSQKFVRQNFEIPNTSDWKSFAFWIFLIVSISCYFGGMNFDYRLIFFASTFLLVGRAHSCSFPQLLINSMVVVLWLSFPSGGLQPLGDLVVEIAVSYTLIRLGTEVTKKIKCSMTKHKLL
jgi:hypothetical protein